jgi:transcriptional regulator with XRE-family HTH domain
MIERGDKNPSFETFIKIANTLEVSADVLLHDELVAGYEIKNSLLNERLEKVSREDRAMIYEVIDTMLKHMKQTKF